MSLRVVFMGTPQFAVPALEAVQQRHQIVSVYAQPDRPAGRGLERLPPPVKRRALELGLSVHQPEKLSAPGEFERFRDLKPDVVVVVAYGKILKQSWLDVPRLGFVNIHSSLLPRWRGAAPIQWAILGGDAESGVTTMRLVEKLDAGEILKQVKTPIAPDDTAGTLHDRLAILGAELIVPTLQGLDDGTLKGRAQDETQVTYAAKLEKEMELLDPAESAAQLDRKIRALNPWPGTSVWVEIAGEVARLKIKRAKPRSDLLGNEGGIYERAGMLLLGTREGALELQALQWDGKKETDASGFANGLRGRGISLPLMVKGKA